MLHKQKNMMIRENRLQTKIQGYQSKLKLEDK